MKRVTDDEHVEAGLRLWDDGQKIAFSRNRGDVCSVDPKSGEQRVLLESWNQPSYDFAPDGKLWFSIHVPKDAPTEGGSMGFITPDFQYMTRFPPLDLIPDVDMPGADGIAIDPVTGDIWFCEFFRDRIGRLQEVPRLP